MLISIFIQYRDKTVTIVTERNELTPDKLYQLMEQRMDIRDCGFSICSKPFPIDKPNDERTKAIFEEYIKDRCIIFVLERLLGGSEEKTISESEILDLVTDVTTSDTADCTICTENRNLIFHCVQVCIQCAKKFIQDMLNNANLSCALCHSRIHLSDINKSAMIKSRLDQIERVYIQREELCSLINVSSHCGALMVNVTLYAKQKCKHCKSDFCTFCLRDWNPTMKNLMFNCGEECTLPNKTKFTLVEFNASYQGSGDIRQIPDRRLCPTCGRAGMYGNKCKFHVCKHCHTEFCFLCLKKKESCATAYNIKCSEPIRQGYDDLPRMRIT